MATTDSGVIAGQHLLEMPPRQCVLALQEEGAGELQPHPHKLRAVHEDGPEGGDGFVELLVAHLALLRLHGGLDRRHAGPEARPGLVPGAPGGGCQKQCQRAKQDQADEEGFHGPVKKKAPARKASAGAKRRRGRAAQGRPSGYTGLRGCKPLPGYCFSVAYAPATSPSVKWALKLPKMPVGRLTGSVAPP